MSAKESFAKIVINTQIIENPMMISVFFSSGLLKPPFLFSGFEAEIKFLWDSESKALESLAKPAEFQGTVKRIFLKWDGLWHYVSVFKLLFSKFIILPKMLNMEIIKSIFSSPLADKVESASQQIYQVFLKRNMNEIEPIKDSLNMDQNRELCGTINCIDGKWSCI